jgi:hypothetical protein
MGDAAYSTSLQIVAQPVQRPDPAMQQECERIQTHGAQPGIVTKGAPAVGESYRQEYYSERGGTS